MYIYIYIYIYISYCISTYIHKIHKIRWEYISKAYYINHLKNSSNAKKIFCFSNS